MNVDAFLTLVPAWAPPLTLTLYALVTLFLLPAALQDHRTRHVSNWLTVPLFFLAWPAAIYLNTFVLTFAVFIGFWLAFKLSGGMGPADGKIAVGLAALTPLSLFAGIAISALSFLWLRLRGARDVRLPGAVAFYLGCVLSFGLLALGLLFPALHITEVPLGAEAHQL